MRIRIVPVAAAVALLALSGCAHAVQDPAATPTAGEPYEATVMVIDTGSGPNACTVIMESWPPQCGDPLPIVGWDWSAVTGYEQSGERRWGSYTVSGVVVDGTLHITEKTVPLGSPLPQDTGEILQPGHGTGPETGR